MRLILDMRPPNAGCRLLEGLSLPHACCFCKLQVGPSMALRLSLRDASNFYYLLAVPAERWPYQAVGEAVSKRWWDEGCPEECLRQRT